MVSKSYFFLLFFIGEKQTWYWGGGGGMWLFAIGNGAPREGQKIPCIYAGEMHAGKVKLLPTCLLFNSRV